MNLTNFICYVIIFFLTIWFVKEFVDNNLKPSKVIVTVDEQGNVLDVWKE